MFVWLCYIYYLKITHLMKRNTLKGKLKQGNNKQIKLNKNLIYLASPWSACVGIMVNLQNGKQSTAVHSYCSSFSHLKFISDNLASCLYSWTLSSLILLYSVNESNFHTYTADEIKGLLTPNKQITWSNICITWTLSSQLYKHHP